MKKTAEKSRGALPKLLISHLLNALYSPVENKNDRELDFKVFFFTDSCCSDIVHDESN